MIKLIAGFGLAGSMALVGCGVSSSHSTPPPAPVPADNPGCGTFWSGSGPQIADSIPHLLDSPTNLPSIEQRVRNYDGVVNLFAYSAVWHASANKHCLTPEVLEVNYDLRSNSGITPLINLSWSSIVGASNYGQTQTDGSHIAITLHSGDGTIPVGQEQGFPLFIRPEKARVPRDIVIWTKPNHHIRWRTVETGTVYEGDVDLYFTPTEKVIVFE